MADEVSAGQPEIGAPTMSIHPAPEKPVEGINPNAGECPEGLKEAMAANSKALEQLQKETQASDHASDKN